MSNIPFEMSDELVEALKKMNKTIMEEFERSIFGDTLYERVRQEEELRRTGQKRKPGWKTFNEVVTEDLIYGFRENVDKEIPGHNPGHVRHGKLHVQWNTTTHQAEYCCGECNELLSLHKKGKCPTIIDAKFIEEEKPQLPSGKES